MEKVDSMLKTWVSFKKNNLGPFFCYSNEENEEMKTRRRTATTFRKEKNAKLTSLTLNYTASLSPDFFLQKISPS